MASFDIVHTWFLNKNVARVFTQLLCEYINVLLNKIPNSPLSLFIRFP